MSENAIEISDVSLSFPLYGLGRSVTRYLSGHDRKQSIGGDIDSDNNDATVHALRNINLSIKKGERVALTGHNGAGKSTLLRVMAGIYMPDSGSVMLDGKLATLLNPSAGMQQNATGYENIMIRGLLQGMTRDEIENCIPDIEEFTELGSYLSVPIERYSKGMRLRLAFGIATATKPDVILIDEWINAGDASFRQKARERILSFIGDNSTLVLATHSEQVIRTMCRKIIKLEHGKVRETAPVMRPL